MPGKSTINITFKLDGDGKGFQDLAKNADGLKAAMSAALVESDRLKTSLVNWNQSVQALQAVNGAIGQLQGVMSSVTADSASFSKAMASANTMAGKDAKAFGELKSQVSDLAKTIPIARDELAGGLYQVISNGVPEDNWIDFLQSSARASVGGIADLGTAVTVTSSLIKNYGLAWEDAADIQDKIQLTAKNGVTSFEQLGAALPSVAGSAAQLGVSMDELLAVFATCTGVTGNTAEVSTQLGAVLSALVKPSSEAAKAAEDMGIRFDAAAVKEAGGLDNFLKALDVSIQQYAAKTGQLSETIYGQLFGSQRALRTLTALTGEQSAKFTENIAIMADSAGTMDAAYETMSGTASAHTQVLHNMFAAMTDVIAGAVGFIQPYASVVLQVGQATLGFTSLVKSAGQLRSGLAVLTGGVRTAMAMITLFTTAEGRAAIATNGLGAASRAAAVGVNGLSMAIRGAMIATGVGAAIAALSIIIEKLISRSKQAKDATADLNQEMDAMADVHRSETQAMSDAQAAINEDIATLGKYADSGRNASKVIQDMAKKYGPYLKACKSAAEAKQALIAHTKEYVQQLGLEARAQAISRAMADAQVQVLQAQAEKEDIVARNSAGMQKASKEDQEAVRKCMSEINKGNQTLNTLQTALDDVSGQLAQKTATVKSDTTETTTNTAAVKAQQTEYQKLTSQINALKDAMATQSGDELEASRESVQGLIKRRDAMDANMALAERPLSLKSLKDYDAEIAYLTRMRGNASQEDVAAWQRQIDATEDAKARFQAAGFVPMALDEIKTYQQLEDEISRYDKAIANATGDERARLIANRADLLKVQDGWDQADADAQIALLGEIDTLDKVDKVISNLDAKIRKASGQELQDLLKQRDGYEQLRKSLTAYEAVRDMRGETGAAFNDNGTRTTEFRVVAEEIGFKDLQKRIEECEAIIADPNFDETLRPQLERLIEQYQQLAKAAAYSYDTLKDGWNSIEGIGSGVQSISNALSDNANAWERVTGVIDGAMQVYDGVMAIIGIIQMLSQASEGHGEAAVVEGGEVVAGGAEQVAAAGEVAIAAGIQAAANEEATQANLDLAASEIFAAHAYIPFAGVAIASGFIAQMMAMMEMVKMPTFAEGGIAYGPTLGLFGEYAGAASNPEVVAPLDRLRTLLDGGVGGGGEVRFRIDGRTLVGVLDNENNHRRRT